MKNQFMNLAKEHTKVHTASKESDIYIGYQLGLEKGMEALAYLPELAADPEVQAILSRLGQALPALPLETLAA